MTTDRDPDGVAPDRLSPGPQPDAGSNRQPGAGSDREERPGRRRALILSGGGRYADPWHPFEATSSQLGEILSEAGFEVEITQSIAERMRNLDGVDLLVANAANPDPELDQRALADARAGLLNYFARGGAAMGVHVSVTTLLSIPEWSETMGARWVPGQSMHPPRGPAHVRVVSHTPDLAVGIDGFDLDDELYCRLDVRNDLDVVVAHEFDDRLEPLVWARREGAVRAVADCLGHNEDSFRSVEHRRLVARAARWLVGDSPTTG